MYQAAKLTLTQYTCLNICRIQTPYPKCINARNSSTGLSIAVHQIMELSSWVLAGVSTSLSHLSISSFHRPHATKTAGATKSQCYLQGSVACGLCQLFFHEDDVKLHAKDASRLLDHSPTWCAFGTSGCKRPSLCESSLPERACALHGIMLCCYSNPSQGISGQSIIERMH